MNEMSACISGNVREGASPSPLSSRIGGDAFLPPGIDHPCDKSETAMLFIAQINFAELPDCDISRAREGLFMLFWNKARDYSNPKDRKAFRCVWLPNPSAQKLDKSIAPDTSIGGGAQIEFSLAQSNNQPAPSTQMQLFGQASKDFQKLQEICAFAGNGVSWSKQRREDSCYSHLVDSAKDWQLFWQLNSMPDLGLDLHGKSMNLLIRTEDFEQQNYEKAWLLVD